MKTFFPFEKNPKIGVAVSGGADSFALTLLAKNWAKGFNGSIIGITIDHSIRNSSYQEALYVKRELKKFKINHEIIKYQGPIPQSRIQEVARNYRYELLGNFCKNNNIFHLLVGHHSLDQKETCLMRSWKGSGMIGMAGMSAVREFKDYRLLRPMLNFDPNDLKKFLIEKNIIWLEDISNKDKFFLRVKARDYLNENQWEVNKLIAKKRIIFEREISKFFAVNAELNHLGFLRFNFNKFKNLKKDLREQILSRSIMTVAGREYPPSISSLRRISNHFSEFSSSKTLGGCLIIKRGDTLFFLREIRNSEPKKIKINDESLIWDQRFKIKISKTDKKHVKLLRVGRKGFDQVTNAGYYIHSSDIPKVAVLSLPALWDREKVVSIPNLGVKLDRNIEITANFSPVQSLSPLGFAVVN